MKISKEFKKYLLEEIKNNSIIIEKNAPERKYLEKAQKIINSPINIHELYADKPYLNTNQNQQYVSKLIRPDYHRACIVASAGDTIFEAVRNDIDFIDAIDINDLQILIFKLRFASICSLNNSEFENFLLDIDNKDILSYSLYISQVSSKIEDEITRNFWERLLKANPPQDILDYYLKGGLERTDIYTIRNMLPYIKKRGTYMNLRNKLLKARIELQKCDMINFLLDNPTRKYDYIDFSNILLFIYQNVCNNSFDEYAQYLKKIKTIFDNNLSDKGSFVIDYMFGIDENNINMSRENLSGVQQTIQELYNFTYEELKKLFDLQTMSFSRASKCLVFDGEKDMILYTRKC